MDHGSGHIAQSQRALEYRHDPVEAIELPQMPWVVPHPHAQANVPNQVFTDKPDEVVHLADFVWMNARPIASIRLRPPLVRLKV